MSSVWWCCLALSICNSAAADALRGLRLVRHESRPTVPNSQSTNGTVFTNATHFSRGSRSFRGDGPPAVQADMCAVGRQYAPVPSLCPVGKDRFKLADLKAAVPGFVAQWAAMKAQFPQQCCMGVNHLFAVYHAVSALQPLAIIESGVAAGHTTWLLRRLAPTARIFSLDPGDPVVNYPGLSGIQGYRDPSPATTYLTGPAFQDLSAARWDVLIPDPVVRARTFVLLDDHQSTVERIKMLRRWGFRNIFYEDNYPFNVATSADTFTCPLLTFPRTYASVMVGDAYSPNTMCAPVPEGTKQVLYKDRFGKVCKWITLPEHKTNLAFLEASMLSYYEYPALFSPCEGVRETVLSDLGAWGLPLPDHELWFYGHLHPPLIQLKPLQPAEVNVQLAAAIQAADLFTLRVSQGLQPI